MSKIQTIAPFLTIGIASYNYASYLLRAFEQIKKQTFQDFEILYCDDGSTDNSVSIIRELIRTNPDLSIRLIEGQNEGILANKNRILQHAKGTYLMICDADDFMLGTCLEELCCTALKTNADCIIGGFQEIDGTDRILKYHIPSNKSCKWLYTWHHAQIYKTELIQQHGIHFSELPDDVAYLQQIHLYSTNIVFVDKTLYAWVRHSDSVSRDTMTNPDWNPIMIWENVSNCIAAIRQKVNDESDKKALTYYLYKWFYLNLSDLHLLSLHQARKDIGEMKESMKRVCPDYRKLYNLISAIRVKDTTVARVAVIFCWLFDKLHIAILLPVIRTIQKRIRKQREQNGKT